MSATSLSPAVDEPLSSAPTRLQALPFAGTVLLSALLLFLVQPLIAKQILAWFGGSAAVWTTCLVFFQGVLLAGYAYADFIQRLSTKTQTRAHLLLLIASLLALPILPGENWKPRGDEQPMISILVLLAASVGLPYFLLSSTTPLLQSWYARRFQAALPYRLFALSNFASLVALLGFPLLFEPWFTMPQLAWAWSAGYACFVAACALASWSARSGSAAEYRPVATDATAAAPTFGQQASWLVLSAMGSIMLLAVTTHITQNVASVPFLWVLPLSLYLITLTLCFEHPRWYVRPFFVGLLALALPIMASQIPSLRLGRAAAIYLGGLFIACMFCHGELAREKPIPRYLTRFYLMLSLGGAIGAVLVAIIAPLVLAGYFEINLAIVFLAVLLFVRPTAFGESWSNRAVRIRVAALAALGALAIVVLSSRSGYSLRVLGITVPAIAALCLVQVRGLQRLAAGLVLVATCGFAWWSAWTYARDMRVMQRDFYGVVRTSDRTREGVTYRAMYHGDILHGGQLQGDEFKGRATDYFGRTSGYGRTFAALNAIDPQPRRIGIIGLGAGVAAAYGRAGDELTFYEISPTVVDVQQREFTYLRDTPAKTRVVLGDGRLSLEREPANRYQLLGVDAFSGDSIPMHLITREAMDLYLSHLADDGVLVFQVTNRFVALAPVIARLAKERGLEAVIIADEPKGEDRTVYSAQSTEQVLVTRNKKLLEHPVIKEVAKPIEDWPWLPTFTDSSHNLFRILK